VKYKIKAGQEFDLVVEPQESFSWKKAATVLAVAIVFAVVMAAATYGFFTGDWAPLKAFADLGRKGLERLIDVAVAKMQ